MKLRQIIPSVLLVLSLPLTLFAVDNSTHQQQLEGAVAIEINRDDACGTDLTFEASDLKIENVNFLFHGTRDK